MENQQYTLSQTLVEIVNHAAGDIVDSMLDSDVMDLESSTSLSSDTESWFIWHQFQVKWILAGDRFSDIS